MSLVTTLPAQITAPRPMHTPFRVSRSLTHTSSSIITGCDSGSSRPSAGGPRLSSNLKALSLFDRLLAWRILFRDLPTF